MLLKHFSKLALVAILVSTFLQFTFPNNDIKVNAGPFGPEILCDGAPYLVTAPASSSTLNKVDSSTSPFGFTPLGPSGPLLNALAYNYQDGYMYAIEGSTPFNKLYRINASGIITDISASYPSIPTQSGAYNVGSMDLNGNYYFTRSPTLSRVYKLNLASGVVTSVNTSTGFRVGDWSPNPIDGKLYGHDYNTNQIVSIDPVSGAVNTSIALTGTLPSVGIATGASWTNALGEMFIYGSSKIYKTNLTTGATVLLSNAPSANNADAASCPFAPIFEKTVSPTTIQTGGTVTYTYKIVNGLPTPLTASFSDIMPDARTFVASSITQTGFTTNGTPNAYAGTGTLNISNYTIPGNGTATITAKVKVPLSIPGGTVTNQAKLTGLPAIMGDILSDNPATARDKDATPLIVTTPAQILCDGSAYIINGTPTNTAFYKVNTTTSPFTNTQIGATTGAVNSLGYNFQDGFMYVMNRVSPLNGVFRIDANGVYTDVSSDYPTIPVNTYNIGAIDLNGNYYIALGSNITTFAKVNLATGAVTNVTTSPSGSVTMADWAFNPVDGKLYGVDQNSNNIVTIDTTTGAITVVGPLTGTTPPPFGPIGNTWFDADGYLYLYENGGNIYKVKPTVSGATTLVSAAAVVASNDGASCAYSPILDKTVSPTIARAGDTVTYTYKIVNGLPTPLTASFSDIMPDARTFVASSITQTGFTTNGTPNAYAGTGTLNISNYTIPGNGTATITAQVLIPLTQASATINNQASLTGLPTVFGDILSNNPLTSQFKDATPLAINNARIELDKAATYNDTNGNSAGDVGETITYQFTVKNTGDLPLTNVTISDPSVTVLGGPISLGVGAQDSVTFTATHIVTAADILAGTFTNTAAAIGTPPTGPAVTDTSNDPNTPAPNDATVTPIPPFAFSDVKDTSVNTSVTYNPLTNDILPSGTVLTKINGVTPVVGTPIPVTNGTVTLNSGGTFTVSPNPGFTGQITFPYSVTTPTSQILTATDTINVYKAVDDTKETAFNTPITYDPKANDTIPSGSTISKINGVVPVVGTPIPVTGGTVTLTATGTFTVSPTTGSTIPIVFPYEVTTLSGVKVTATDTVTVAKATDDTKSTNLNTPITYDPKANDTIPSGSTISKINGVVPVVGTPIPVTGGTVTLTAAGTFTVSPTTGFIGAITFPYEVTTPSGSIVTATDTVNVYNVADDNKTTLINTPVTYDPKANDTIPSGSTISKINGVVPVVGTPINVIGGTVTLTAAGTFTVSPTTGSTTPIVFPYEVSLPDGTKIIANDTVTIENPKLEIDKASVFNDTNSNGIGEVGETISYQFTVKNIGNVPLTNVTVTDPLVTVSGTAIPTLAVGASDSTTFTATYVITAADVLAGKVENTATATGTPPNGPNATDTSNDPSTAGANDPTVTKIPPFTQDDIKTTLNGTPVTYNPLINDKLPVGSRITQINNTSIAVGVPFRLANATVTLNADNTFTVTPDAGFSGAITFSYSIVTPQGDTRTSQNTVTVEATSAPIALINSLLRTGGLNESNSIYSAIIMLISGISLAFIAKKKLTR
jgi:uncharacterized repeat protein (TIGR01451 family)